MTMRVGLVSYWFNRGQAMVARWLRDTLHKVGYETHVLARPASAKFIHPGRVDTDDVWHQERVTPASQYEIPAREYLDWAESAGLDVVMVDQNYQFEELDRLRRAGVRVVGRFVWEAISPEQALEAAQTLDVIYSFTRAEQERYRELDIATPLVPFGCHPELLPYAKNASSTMSECDGRVRFFYPAGFQSRRKPTGVVLEAFSRVVASDAQLTIKSQRALKAEDRVLPVTPIKLKRGVVRRLADEGAVAEIGDDRVKLVTSDVTTHDYYELFSSHDVCLAPSRWEGLGIHLYEATAFGLPIVANDIPPINEVAVQGQNGWLCESWCVGKAPSGIAAYEPYVDSLAEGVERMLSKEERERAAEGARRRRTELDWTRTEEALAALVQGR
jgi:glycosyltransferase involved in cell wall biosynthesis